MLPHVRYGAYQRYEDLLLPRVLMGDAAARKVFLLTSISSTTC